MYAREFPVRNWLTNLGDGMWGALPPYYQRLLAEKYGLEARGAELGLVIERPMGLRELAAQRQATHQNLAVLIHRALGFLMRRILLDRIEAGDKIFPAELLDTVFPITLHDRPEDEPHTD